MLTEKSNTNNSEKIEPQKISFESPNLFEQWLDKNNTIYEGIWLRFYKKDSGIKTIFYDQALDVALCYGWIDGQAKKYDKLSYLQKFTPRRVRSQWSKRNVEKALKLIEMGSMKPSGFNEIERAKNDGRWEKAYDSPSKMVIPEDFIVELSNHPEAFSFFQTLDKVNLYSIGYRLQTAKDEDSRTKRKTITIEMMKRSEKFH